MPYLIDLILLDLYSTSLNELKWIPYLPEFKNSKFKAKDLNFWLRQFSVSEVTNWSCLLNVRLPFRTLNSNSRKPESAATQKCKMAAMTSSNSKYQNPQKRMSLATLPSTFIIRDTQTDNQGISFVQSSQYI